MTYQAFESADGEWEIWNIKTNRLIARGDMTKARAVELVTKWNRPNNYSSAIPSGAWQQRG